MSHPNNMLAERFVPSGYASDMPVVLNGVPYTVVKGDTVDDCSPNCIDEPERINVGLPNEAFLTTVYTASYKEAITVKVLAEQAVAIDQYLYIHPTSTPTDVILTNLDDGTLDLWGKVFEFSLPSNTTPNTNVWLTEGATGTTGLLDAVMVECNCPDLSAIVPPVGCTPFSTPDSIVIVDGVGGCGNFATLASAMADSGTVSGSQIWVISDTVEDTTVAWKNGVDVFIYPTVTVAFGTPATSWGITPIFLDGVTAKLSGGKITFTDDDGTCIFITNGSKFTVEQTEILALGEGVGEAISVQATGSLTIKDSRVYTEGTFAIEHSTTGVTTVTNCLVQSINASNGVAFKGQLSTDDIYLYNNVFEGGLDALDFQAIPTTYNINGNTFKGGTGYAFNSALVWNNANISMNTLHSGTSGGFNNVTPTVGLTNDII